MLIDKDKARELLEELYNLNSEMNGKNRPISLGIAQRLGGYGYPSGYVVLYDAIKFMEGVVDGCG